MVAKKQIVDVEVCHNVSFFDAIDCMTPEEVIETMKGYQKSYAGRDIYFCIRSYGYDGGKDLLTLRERRLETDREFEKRVDLEKKAKAQAEEAKATKYARELAEYERLKKKFEK